MSWLRSGVKGDKATTSIYSISLNFCNNAAQNRYDLHEPHYSLIICICVADVYIIKLIASSRLSA